MVKEHFNQTAKKWDSKEKVDRMEAISSKVVEILNNSVYDLLICELKNKQELIIPLLDKFILKINDESITVHCIEGLMEI